MAKDARTIQEELSRPFAPEDLEWRIQQAFEDKGCAIAVPYVTNRAIQERLDEVVGPDNWCNEYRPWHGNGKKEAQICGISIYFEGRGWVTKPNRKYRWLSTRHEENGTRSFSWIHVTGDRTRKRAFLTEGPLKGDVASFLAHDALFICTGGVNATKGLRETIDSLGITEVVEAMDMDQFTNPQVMRGIKEMRKEVMGIPGLKYSKYTWDPAYKGVDDYFLSRVAAM